MQRRAQVLRLRIARVVHGHRLVDDVVRLHGGRADDRALVGQTAGGDVGDALAVPPDAQHLAVGDLADDGAVEVPAHAHLAHVGDLLVGDDRQHALLALADHDLPRLHVGLAQRHAVGVDVEAHVALARHLRAGAGEAGGAEVLHAHHELAVDELEARLDELLLGERVADLDARALLLERLVELLAGEHAGAADAVAAGLGADEHHVVADAAGDGAHDAVGADEAGGERVDEAVALVAGLEVDLAAHGGDAEAVAVVGDAADDAVEQEALARLGELAEAQRVHARRTGARPW